MYNSEEGKEITELNNLVEQEIREDNNPDYQQYITIMGGQNENTQRFNK